MKASDKVAKARTGLVLDNPFFGSLALRLQVIEEACGTFATDGIHLWYDPEFVDTLDLETTKGILAHEVMHCALGHTARLKGRDAEQWNRAADYAINPLLLDAGFKLTEGALNEREYRDMSADKIYKLLPTPKSGEGEGGGSGKPGEQDGKSGSGKPGQNPNGEGEVREPKNDDGSSKSSSEMKQVEQEWKVAMTQAAQTAKKAGCLPGNLERLVTELVDPKVNWTEILRRFVDSYSRNDYAMFPPNRRYVSMGLYLPSARSEEMGTICAVMDTSGSVDNETVRQFASELQDISFHYRTETKVIHCDSAVRAVEEFEVDEEISLHPKGGGGTDFRPPFKNVDESGQRPACLIYFTDGYCHSFPEEPEYPVLWAIYGRGSYGGAFEPPFGEVVNI